MCCKGLGREREGGREMMIEREEKRVGVRSTYTVVLQEGSM